jgi:flagellar hook-associated protein 3 FlgL
VRISDKGVTTRLQTGINRTRSEISNLQNQAATMKKITKPSDDPVGTMRVQNARTDRDIGNQFLRNIHLAKTNIDASEQALGEAAEIIMRLKELAISQSSDAAADAVTRRSTAVEVDQLFGSMVNVGNRKFGERFLFGGYQVQKSPFEGNGEYKGDDGEIRIEVNRGVYMPVNINGAELFLGGDAGYDSPWEKKPARETHLNEAASELDKPVVRGPASVEDPEKANVRGQEDLLAKNEMNPQDQVAPGLNIFTVIRSLGTAMQTNDKKMIQSCLEPLDTALAQFVHARAKLGARSTNLQATMESIQKQNVDIKVLESNVEDADTFELFTDIKKAQTALDATLSTSGKLIQPSLLDFLK